MKYDEERFKRVKERVAQIIADQGNVKTMFKELADMYWVSEGEASVGNSNGVIRYNHSAFDKNEVRLTASTSSRDRVTGLHRMMRTTQPHFSVSCDNKQYADKIERALDKWWKASCERKRATVESELTLSGILFSDENLVVTAVDDMIADIEKALQGAPDSMSGLLKRRLIRLTELRKRTPILFEAESPMVAYPVWGEDGLSEYLSVFTLKGRTIRERWGVPGLNDTNNYILYDYWDLEIRCVYINGYAEPIKMDSYDLPDMPRFSSICDGTDLFPEEIRKRQPFLYGMWKSGLHKREDETLTVLFTSILARGIGPLAAIDSSQPNYNAEEIKVQYRGLFRYVTAPGGVKFAADQAYDANLLQALQMVNEWGERTTIPSQTLGENIQPGTPYSGYAMASQNGRIPIVPIQEGTQKVIKDAACYVLRCIKDGIIETEELKPADILDDVDVEVKLEVDLPQDAFRTAQMIAQLKASGVPLSNEWLHNTLQIKDSNKMTMDTLTEQATMEAFKADLPNLIQQMLGMLGGPPSAPAPEEAPEGMHSMPDGSMMPDSEMQYPTMPGGPQAAMAGGEMVPATEPMNPNGAERGRA